MLEPVKGYNEYYKEQFNKNAEMLFDKLLKESSVDVEENRKTVKQHKNLAEDIRKQNKSLSLYKFFRVLLIIVTIISCFVLFYGISIQDAVLISVPIVLSIVSLVLIFALLNKKIKLLKQRIASLNVKAKEIYNLALSQTQPLNVLFDSEMTADLIRKTVPEIVIDKRFDLRRFDYMNSKYGLAEEYNSDTSTLNVLSGEISNNPYIFERTLKHRIGSQTYTGMLTISWTTYHRDSKGNTVTRRHTQVLHAHVVKPKPFYDVLTTCVYGNDAAPDLSFSHTKSHAEKWNEKQLASKVKSRIKKIRQKTAKNVASGFTEMGNEQFDALFGALDRDNEVQFRLLFTPLAQKNMLNIIKGGSPYGDDFDFYKRKSLNYVVSEHSQFWDMDTSAHKFATHDVDQCKNIFIKFNEEYFKSFYFDLAPLLSIPLYQQTKPSEYEYRSSYARNYTARETEILANRLGKALMHPATRTNVIYKTQFIRKEKDVDVVDVFANSYKTIRRVDFIPVFGGDGRMHAVPVPWLQYIPLSKRTEIRIKSVDLTDNDFRKSNYASSLGDYAFYHDLFATTSNDGALTDDSPNDFDEDGVDYSDVVEEKAEKIENLDKYFED